MARRFLTAGFLLVLVASACATDELPTSVQASAAPVQPPVVALTAREADGGLITLSAATVDPSGSGLTISWNAEKGDLSALTGPSTQWRPPAEAGIYAVTVEVANAQGGRRSATQRFQVAGNGKASATGQVQISEGTPGTAVVGTGRFQVPTAVPVATPTLFLVGANPEAPAGPQATPVAPVTQPVATPVAGPTPTGQPPVQPIATPTPTPPPATPTPTPTPTPRPPTPEPGVPVPPPSRWERVNPLNVPTSSALRDLHFVPGATNAFNVGWAVGDNATALQTTDGGLTWAVRNNGLPANKTLIEVFFTSETTGFVVTELGDVFRTTNSGTSWEDISHRPADNSTIAPLSSLTVYNAQILVLTSRLGQVFRSENANAALAANVSWNTMATHADAAQAPSSLFGSGAFSTAADSTVTWLAGDGIFRLDSDGTPQWRRMLTIGSGAGVGVAVDLASPNDIWVGTGNGFLFISKDAGASWSSISEYRNREFNGGNPLLGTNAIYDIDTIDANHVWVLRPNEVLDTNDGGQSWKLTGLPTNLNNIMIRDRVVAGGREFFGWGVGSGGAIFRYVPN